MIDSHVHIGGEAEGFIINEELVLQSMENYGVDISIVSNADSVEYGPRASTAAFMNCCITSFPALNASRTRLLLNATDSEARTAERTGHS